MKAILRINDSTDAVSEEEVNVNGTLTVKLDRKEIAAFITRQYQPLLAQFPELKIQYLDTNLGDLFHVDDYTLFLDFCVEPELDDAKAIEMKEAITWWLEHRHERPTGHDENRPMCPYCEVYIDHLAYNGENYYHSDCDTTITGETREAEAFMRCKWDGRGDYEGE